MKIEITKDFNIAHDGINIANYKGGEVIELSDALAKRLIECDAARQVEKPSPVQENKATAPVVEVKRKARKGKKA